MIDALCRLHVAHSPGASLFLFAMRDGLRHNNPIEYLWSDAHSHRGHLM